ncbi:ribosome biogenesis protein BRX1 homolog [Rhinoraja longicauda]
MFVPCVLVSPVTRVCLPRVFWCSGPMGFGASGNMFSCGPCFPVPCVLVTWSRVFVRPCILVTWSRVFVRPCVLVTWSRVFVGPCVLVTWSHVLCTQTFSTPRYHPKSQPFIDHVFTFTITDGRIWFRNYQIIEEDGSLVEIGPRFVLQLIKVFRGSFGGQTLYENPAYRSPNLHRRLLRSVAAARLTERRNVKAVRRQHHGRELQTLPHDPTHAVFDTPAPPRPTPTAGPTADPRPHYKKKLHKRQRLRVKQ